MRIQTIIALIFAILLVLLLCSCPSQKKQAPRVNQSVGQNEEVKEPAQEVEEPAEEESVSRPEEAVQGSPVGAETVAGGGGTTTTLTHPIHEKNPPEIMALFKQYKSWPPESITEEEKAILRRCVVVLQTTKGIIKIRLIPDAAPIHSANFVKLVRDGFYDGLTFHRVIKGFMSQGGDPEGTGRGGPGYTLPAEIGLPHYPGSVAAARLPDEYNPERRSSGSQFYMCHTRERCAKLDGAYTVFGNIVEGQDVNLSLTPTHDDNNNPIPGVVPDKIIDAWVESGFNPATGAAE